MKLLHLWYKQTEWNDYIFDISSVCQKRFWGIEGNIKWVRSRAFCSSWQPKTRVTKRQELELHRLEKPRFEDEKGDNPDTCNAVSKMAGWVGSKGSWRHAYDFTPTVSNLTSDGTEIYRLKMKPLVSYVSKPRRPLIFTY